MLHGNLKVEFEPERAPRRHPATQTLADFLIGNCSPGTAYLLRQHARLCQRCGSLLEEIGAASRRCDEVELRSRELISPGVVASTLVGVAGLGEIVYYLQAEPGASMPLRRPGELCELLVLGGKIQIESEVLAAGDFIVLEDAEQGQVLGRDAFSGLATAPQPDVR